LVLKTTTNEITIENILNKIINFAIKSLKTILKTKIKQNLILFKK
jgi:hypothetical protein